MWYSTCPALRFTRYKVSEELEDGILYIYLQLAQHVTVIVAFDLFESHGDEFMAVNYWTHSRDATQVTDTELL